MINKMRLKKVVCHFFDREIIRYAVSGLLIALVNFGIFFVLNGIGIKYLYSNLVAIILSKCFGYFLNKLFVYKSKREHISETLWEFVRFILARGLTGLIDWIGVIVLVEFFDFGYGLAKLMLQAIVIVLNYVLGKFAVFKKKSTNIRK